MDGIKPIGDPLFTMGIEGATTVVDHCRIDGDNIIIDGMDKAYKRLAMFLMPVEGNLAAPMPFVSKDGVHWVICVGAWKNGEKINLPAMLEEMLFDAAD